jgi:hypothetical protein
MFSNKIKVQKRPSEEIIKEIKSQNHCLYNSDSFLSNDKRSLANTTGPRKARTTGQNNAITQIRLLSGATDMCNLSKQVFTNFQLRKLYCDLTFQKNDRNQHSYEQHRKRCDRLLLPWILEHICSLESNSQTQSEKRSSWMR